MIESLDHIQLAMPPGGEENARAFFQVALEMKEDQKPDPLAGRGGCWFRAGNVVVHIGVDADFIPQKKAHPAFCTPDVSALAHSLEEKGFPVTWDNALPDRKRFYTADPFGNRIEFIQTGDGFHQR